MLDYFSYRLRMEDRYRKLELGMLEYQKPNKNSAGKSTAINYLLPRVTDIKS